MATESDTLFGKLAVVAERENLKAATVGKYRPVPSVKTVQAAGFFYHIHARTEIEVVSVAKYNLGLDVVVQLMYVHTFDRTHRADRHEDGGLYCAMAGLNQACTRSAAGRRMLECEFHSKKLFELQNYAIFTDYFDLDVIFSYFCRLLEKPTTL